VKSSINVILFVYPTICSKVFTTFKCIEVNDRSYLVADMSQRCFEGEWIFWAIVASAAMLLYVVGIPLILLGVLYIGNRDGTLTFPPPMIEYNGGDSVDPTQVTAAVKRLNEYTRNRVAFGSLYDQYEDSYWWFEFGCTMRKMFLTGALVLFGAGTTPQVVTALAVCILWFGIIATLKPFDAAIDDRLAQVEGIQILFTLLIGLVLQLQAAVDGGSKEEEEVLGVVLIILNLAVIALALVQQPLFLKVVAVIGRAIRWGWKRIYSHIRRRREKAAAKENAASTTHSATTVNINPFVSHSRTRKVELTDLSASANAGSASSAENERGSASGGASKNILPQHSLAGAATKTSTDKPTGDFVLRAENDELKQENERLRAKVIVLETENTRLKCEPSEPSAEIKLGAEEVSPDASFHAKGGEQVRHNPDLELGWYYDDHDETERHGPFPLEVLMGWRDSEHLENDLVITREQKDNTSIALLEALFDAGLDNDAWFYDDVDSDVEHARHGPYSLANIKAWVEEGYFGEHDLIRRGREGEAVGVSTVVEEGGGSAATRRA